jgi:phenylacetate-coenzyme A ligase PaaK-like adenylate-forming protein
LEVYHAKKTHFHELIDPRTGVVLEPTTGVEGELVVSAYAGEPAALPLLRYRTGDIVRVVEEKCARHGLWSFTVLGRASLDFLKLPGGVLSAEEAARVIRLFNGSITDRFELHRFERETPGGPKPQVELRVEPKGSIDLAELARDIAENLRVNPARTYALGVADGLYLPLTCSILAPQEGAHKPRRIVAH